MNIDERAADCGAHEWAGTALFIAHIFFVIVVFIANNKEPSDDRNNITVRNMLNMASGIRYGETLVPWCLFQFHGDCSNWYAELPPEAPPGTVFTYSSGSTSLLSRLVQVRRSSNPERKLL